MKNKKTPLNLPLTRETLNKDGKSNGQSLIDVIFSIGILVLTLTGIITLVVTTAKVKTIKIERKKAVELSQLLIEKKILEIKNDPLLFWGKSLTGSETGVSITGFEKYSYVVRYDNCGVQKCKMFFDISWGEDKSLSVERLFLRDGI